MTDREQLLDELRPVAFAIAYRMLGSVSEAEDVVQEALVRVHQALEAGEQLAALRAAAPRPRRGAGAAPRPAAPPPARGARAPPPPPPPPPRGEPYVGDWL